MSATARYIYFFDLIGARRSAGGVVDVTRVLLREMEGQSFSVKSVSRMYSRTFTRLALLVGRFAVETFVFNYLVIKNRVSATPATYLFPNYFLPPSILRTNTTACVVVHDLQFKYYPQYFGVLKRIWLDVNFRRLVSSGARVVFISQSTADDFIKMYGAPANWRVILNPVEWMPQTETGHSKRYGRFMIAAYHFYPHKNFKAAIRVFERLRKSGVVDSLLVTGNGADKFQSQLPEDESHLRNSVAHLGFVHKQTLFSLYKEASAFISMSQFEGFNLSAAEAALMGTPLLLSDIPVHRELFSDVACFVDASAEDLSEAAQFIAGRKASQRPWSNATRCEPANTARSYLTYITCIGDQDAEPREQSAA